MRVCDINGCEKKHKGYGYCSKHYQRFKKYGDPNHNTVDWHGMDGTTEYIIWIGIKRRCNDPKRLQYKDYGARGIKVCDRWMESFRNFHEDMGDRPSKNHSIDRIDNNKGYSKENCRWATHTEQSRNQRVFKTNKSGCRGVSLNKKENVWTVYLGKIYITRNKVLKHAIKARLQAEIDIWGELYQTELKNYLDD